MAWALLPATLAPVACGGEEARRATPEDGVRAAADAYLGALGRRDWTRACALMTPAARRDLADAAGAPCARVLAEGAAPVEEVAGARREVPGADVRVRGSAAALGPIGSAQGTLRLRRVAGRWLVDS